MSSSRASLSDDLDYQDDPSIRDDEGLYRGILKRHLHGPDGPISSAAFKPERPPQGVDRHLSVWREELCTLAWVFDHRLRRSVALARLTAMDARCHAPTVVGVGTVPPHPAHARIIRHRDVTKDDWAEVADALAEASVVAAVRDDRL